MRLLLLQICAAASLLAGCGHERGVYAVSKAEALKLLAHDKLIDLRRNRQCGIVINIVPEQRDGSEVRWTVFSEGRAMMWFAAHLTAEGPDQTRVAIELQKKPNGTEYYMGDYSVPRPAMAKPARSAIEEAIAAILEKRPFNPANASPTESDQLCGVQRGAIDGGKVFSVNDQPADDPRSIDGQ